MVHNYLFAINIFLYLFFLYLRTKIVNQFMKHWLVVANWVFFSFLFKSSILVNISELFAFSLKNDRDGLAPAPWNYLNWNEEFARQGVSNEWKESNFNLNYSYCDTYPEKLWLPEKASTQMLIGSCRFYTFLYSFHFFILKSFRSRARLPVLTFFYKHNFATICR